jgi:hypothetical protein
LSASGGKEGDSESAFYNLRQPFDPPPPNCFLFEFGNVEVVEVDGELFVDKMDKTDKNEDNNESDISLSDYDSAPEHGEHGWRKGRLICTWGHRWQECNTIDYVTRSCLTGRYCYNSNCKVRFVDGKCRLPILPWRYYKPSGGQLGHNCLDCVIAVCAPCRLIYDLASPPRRVDSHSPETRTRRTTRTSTSKLGQS